MALYEVWISTVNTPGAKRRSPGDVVNIRKPLGRVGSKELINHTIVLMELTQTFVDEFFERRGKGEKFPFRADLSKLAGHMTQNGERVTFGPPKRKQGFVTDRKIGV